MEALDGFEKYPVWLLTDYGKPRSVKGLSQWMAKNAREAGLIGKTAHGLGKYPDIELAEASYTSMQIRSRTGQQDLKALEVYIRDADRKRVLLSNGKSKMPKRFEFKAQNG